MSKDFEISRLLHITGKNKYEACVAAFEVITNLEKIDLPRKVQNRKPAVKAMMALSDELVKYDYIDDETRERLEEELRNQGRMQAQSALDAVFSTSGSAAPVADDEEDELDEIVDTGPSESMDEAEASADADPYGDDENDAESDDSDDDFSEDDDKKED